MKTIASELYTLIRFRHELSNHHTGNRHSQRGRGSREILDKPGVLEALRFHHLGKKLVEDPFRTDWDEIRHIESAHSELAVYFRKIAEENLIDERPHGWRATSRSVTFASREMALRYETATVESLYRYQQISSGQDVTSKTLHRLEATLKEMERLEHVEEAMAPLLTNELRKTLSDDDAQQSGTATPVDPCRVDAEHADQ